MLQNLYVFNVLLAEIACLDLNFAFTDPMHLSESLIYHFLTLLALVRPEVTVRMLLLIRHLLIC